MNIQEAFTQIDSILHQGRIALIHCDLWSSDYWLAVSATVLSGTEHPYVVGRPICRMAPDFYTKITGAPKVESIRMNDILFGNWEVRGSLDQDR